MTVLAYIVIGIFMLELVATIPILLFQKKYEKIKQFQLRKFQIRDLFKAIPPPPLYIKDINTLLYRE